MSLKCTVRLHGTLVGVRGIGQVDRWKREREWDGRVEEREGVGWVGGRERGHAIGKWVEERERAWYWEGGWV